MPTGRAMANGDTRVLVKGIVMYAGGISVPRTTTLYVGGASVALGTPVASGGQAIGGATSTRALVGPGGTVEAGMYFSGLTYFGWTSFAGRNIVEKDGSGTRVNASLNGYYDWGEAPSVPQTVVAVADSDSQITLTWTAPADDGGLSLQGYTIIYSKDPTFATGVSTTTTTGLSKVFTGLDAGATYYFRVAARNECTTLAATTGPYAASVSATTDSNGGGERYTGSAWNQLTPERWNGSAWVPLTVERWNGSAWVAVG